MCEPGLLKTRAFKLKLRPNSVFLWVNQKCLAKGLKIYYIMMKPDYFRHNYDQNGR